jgi:hypothetical protein
VCKILFISITETEFNQLCSLTAWGTDANLIKKYVIHESEGLKNRVIYIERVKYINTTVNVSNYKYVTGSTDIRDITNPTNFSTDVHFNLRALNSAFTTSLDNFDVIAKIYAKSIVKKNKNGPDLCLLSLTDSNHMYVDFWIPPSQILLERWLKPESFLILVNVSFYYEGGVYRISTNNNSFIIPQTSNPTFFEHFRMNMDLIQQNWIDRSPVHFTFMPDIFANISQANSVKESRLMWEKKTLKQHIAIRCHIKITGSSFIIPNSNPMRIGCGLLLYDDFNDIVSNPKNTISLYLYDNLSLSNITQAYMTNHHYLDTLYELNTNFQKQPNEIEKTFIEWVNLNISKHYFMVIIKIEPNSSKMAMYVEKI